MSFSSKAYLTHAENLATGTVIAIGSHRRHKEITTRQAINKWLNGLTDVEREQLRIESDYEQQKLNFQQ